ncbi:MAG: DNA recombination protein RmuC [Alphaproteobacteria bacterium]|nr:DNA recombination protein RmuC [Alphaproteobacteria bacterium]
MTLDFSDPLILAAFAGGAFLLVIVILLVVLLVRGGSSRGETERLQAAQMQADRQSQQIAELQGSLRTLSESQSILTKTVQERLDLVGEKLGESLSDSAQKTAKSLGELQERLSVIDKAQENITRLSADVVGLQDILSNKQARGAFGEIQLNDLVGAILPPSAYELQSTLSNGRRADCLIKLPRPPGPIVVDAKFPLESFERLVAAEKGEARTLAERGFRQDVRKHVHAIAERYIIPGETAESALMFLPSEAVYAELHAYFRDVIEDSFRAKVWIVSPTTLMATLNTVRAVLKDAQMREQAHLIQAEVGKMMEDIGRLDDRVDNLGRHFQQAEKDIREIGISTDKITRRAGRIEELELGEDGGLELAPNPPLRQVVDDQ